MIKHALTALLFFFVFSSIGQSWESTTASSLSWRFEDMFFVNDQVGWMVDGGGQIIKTTNGGDTWTQQHYDSDMYFRSVEFWNEDLGFAGTLGGLDTDAQLMKTTNGGETWTEISDNLPVSVPGICGMHMTDENTLFITGVFWGQAYIMKSTDQGDSFEYQSMASTCNGLVDIQFKDDMTGIAVGQSAQGQGLSAIILKTTDGGDNWNVVGGGTASNQRSWKVQWLTDQVLYASIEEFEPSPQYFKSIDGGDSWTLYDVETTQQSGTMQGIGFMNEDLGWIGGWSELFFETTDGGDTWDYQPDIGWSFNRFFKISEGLMYAAGVNFYRYDATSTSVAENPDQQKPAGHQMKFLGSNVIQGQATLQLNLINHTFCEVSIYDINGRRVETIATGRRNAGEYTFDFDTSSWAKGQYFVALYTYHGYEPLSFMVK